MNESKNTPPMEYIEVTIGAVKMRTTKAMADRFIRQMEKQDQRFYSPVQFVEPVSPKHGK